MKKRLISILLALCMVLALIPTAASAYDYNRVDPTDYAYEVIPLLEPFNHYFLVKTNNPDPDHFRFVDKDSVYSDSSTLTAYSSLYNNGLLADVVYEDEETKRVKGGGYIFSSFDTDGGEIVLQSIESLNYMGEPVGCQDTDIKIVLPALCDVTDYLIDTYAQGDTFFDKMDAVETGFSSICLYSGSNIRGNLVKNGYYDFWRLAASRYADQSFYIYSPYNRQGDKSLFASAIYPFIYDSLGYPSVMASVSKRLDANSSYEWDSYVHAYVNVTYNGQTRTYGGQGTGEGQGLSEDKITRFFTFDGDENITLEGTKKLLDDYSQVEMEDDIPHEDALTWEMICNTVGDGSWVHTVSGYSYFYRADDKNNFEVEEMENGNSLYISGSLDYASDAWIDGRYVDDYEQYEPGATFEDYPDSDIILINMRFLSVSYCLDDLVYNPETKTWFYADLQVTERTGNLIYHYDEEENAWITFNDYYYDYDEEEDRVTCSDYWNLLQLVEIGQLDEKYLDMLKLTYDEVMELGVDRNTNIAPDRGYIFDGNSKPGTAFDTSAVNTEDPDVLFADAKKIAEENGLAFRLEDGYYGMCGESMFWVYLEDSQTLILTGSGDMRTLGDVPWYQLEDSDHMQIKQLFVGEGVVSLQNRAFSYCSELEKAVLPNSLRKLGTATFQFCESLKEVNLPSGLTEIGDEVFYYCASLNNVTIPNSITAIGRRVFVSCYSLTDIYYGGSESQWKQISVGEENRSLTYATIHYNTAVPESPSASAFTDVSERDWFYDGVAYVVWNGLMQGVGGGKFAPSGTTTRGMIVTILYRLEGKPTVSQSTFTDVAAGQWYADAISWAAANQIVDGYGNNSFGPNDNITREQIATILYRYAVHKGYDVSGLANLSGYNDAETMHNWALTAMRWANHEGLITGRTTTTLVPSGTTTRAEAATILMRFCQNVAGLP